MRAYLTGAKDTAVTEMSVHLAGSEGRIVIDMSGIRLMRVHNENPRTQPGVPSILPISPRWSMAGMQAAIADLVRAMDEGRDPASPPESARATVAVTQAVLLSQARGNVVVHLDELAPSSTTST